MPVKVFLKLIFIFKLFSPYSTVDPPIIKHAFSEEVLQPGPSVFLKCIATGNPTPEITWKLDNKKLSNTDRYGFNNLIYLLIQSYIYFFFFFMRGKICYSASIMRVAETPP